MAETENKVATRAYCPYCKKYAPYGLENHFFTWAECGLKAKADGKYGKDEQICFWVPV
jgi:hypothetical protein